MIQTDQTTIFADKLIVGLSSLEDGNQKPESDEDYAVAANQDAFLSQIGIALTYTTRIEIDYKANDFCRYSVVEDDQLSEGMGIIPAGAPRDGMIIDRPG